MQFTEIYGHMPSIVICLVHSEKKARKALRSLGMNDELIPSCDAGAVQSTLQVEEEAIS